MLAFCSQGSEFESWKSHSFFLWKIPLSVFGTQKSKVLVTDENWTQDFSAKVDWLIKAPPAFPAFAMSLFQVRYLHKLGYDEKKKNLVRRLKKAQSYVKKPGESNRDLFRALRGCV